MKLLVFSCFELKKSLFKHSMFLKETRHLFLLDSVCINIHFTLHSNSCLAHCYHRLLYQASGKLLILDQLLRKLHCSGHRVLLFAQMTHTLDILQVRFSNNVLNALYYLSECIDEIIFSLF